MWACPVCEDDNPIEVDACRRCGTAFGAIFGTGAPPEPRRSAGVALALSALLPGLGHAYLRNAGAAISRAIMYVWTLGLSLLLLLRPPKAGRAVVRGVAVVFLVSAIAVWGVSFIESQRLAAGDRTPLVSPRAFTWFAGALSVVLFIGMLGAGVSGR